MAQIETQDGAQGEPQVLSSVAINRVGEWRIREEQPANDPSSPTAASGNGGAERNDGKI